MIPDSKFCFNSHPVSSKDVIVKPTASICIETARYTVWKKEQIPSALCISNLTSLHNVIKDRLQIFKKVRVKFNELFLSREWLQRNFSYYPIILRRNFLKSLIFSELEYFYSLSRIEEEFIKNLKILYPSFCDDLKIWNLCFVIDLLAILKTNVDRTMFHYNL